MEPEFMGKRHDDGTAAATDSLKQSLLMGIDDEEQQTAMVVENIMQLNSNNSMIGEKQTPRFRDVWAAIIFVATQIGLLYLAFFWGIPALNYTATDSSGSGGYQGDPISFTGILWLCLLSSLAALLIAAVALAILMRHAQHLIQISLGLSVVCHVAMMIFFLLERLFLAAGLSLVLVALSACYVWSVWRRIPFAASNLMTALTAVQANGGLVGVAYGLTAVVNLFSVVWLLAWLGVYVRSATCSNQECTSHMHPLVVFGFLLCYYWTAEVGQNVLKVTTAGVVGTFWFAPEEASSFCSPAVHDSLARATTYSAGSICLGSLLTALLQTLHAAAHQARQHGRHNDLVLCILECILGCLERLVAYFNKWAFVYIGLYGYDYLTAGKKVMDLFVDRGWTTIINDNLVARVLGMVSVVIGGLTGCVGLLLASVCPRWVEEFGDASTLIAFGIPALIGMAMAYILMSLVGSAVDTVVVAFAEAPMEFERNHPGLYAHMSTAWRQVYPEEFGR